MKKVLLPLFTLILVFGMLFTSFSSVNALAVDEPVVTPVSGDMEFTTTVVSIASHPGVTELPGGLQVPVGFPAGEAQFGSDAVSVTDFASGKAAACFSITGVEYGWGGKVGMWDGSKWVLLPTSITNYDENLVSSACATISSSGTYIFIQWIADPALLVQAKPACFDLAMDYYTIAVTDSALGGQNLRDFYGNFTPNANSWVTYRVINASPGITGDLSGSTTSDAYGDFDFSPSTFYVPDGGYFTIRYEIPQCYVEVNYIFIT